MEDNKIIPEYHMGNIAWLVVIIRQWQKKSISPEAAMRKIASIRRENEDLKSTNVQLSEENTALNRRTDTCSLTAFFNSFAASQAQQNTQLLIQTLQQQLKEANDKYADTKSQLDRLKSKHTTETQSLRQELVAEKQQNSELKMQVAQLKERNRHLEEEALQIRRKHEQFAQYLFFDKCATLPRESEDMGTAKNDNREQPEMKPCRGGSDVYRRRGESVISDADYISADESTNDDENDTSNETRLKEVIPSGYDFESRAAKGIQPGTHGQEYTHSPPISENYCSE